MRRLKNDQNDKNHCHILICYLKLLGQCIQKIKTIHTLLLKILLFKVFRIWLVERAEQNDESPALTLTTLVENGLEKSLKQKEKEKKLRQTTKNIFQDKIKSLPVIDIRKWKM